MNRAFVIRLSHLVALAVSSLIPLIAPQPARAEGGAWPLVGQLGGGLPYFVAVNGDYAYIAALGAMTVVDVSSPGQPRQIGFCDTPGEAVGVAVAGAYAYVADGTSGLRVINVSNAAAPVEVGSCDTPGYAYGVAVAGGYAYVADGSAGLRVIDVSDPAAPLEVGFLDTPGTAYHVAVAGGYAYIADGASGLRVINVSNAAAPVEVGSWDTPGSAHHVAVAGGYAYIADGASGLRVINVSNAAAPVEVASWGTPGTAHHVVVAGGYAYVAHGSAGLRVIDVSDPAAPVEVGYLDTPSLAVGVAVAGGYAYVAGYDAGLRVISISNPAQPVEIGYYGTLGSINDVAVAGEYAYVADWSAGLRVIDVSDPAAPLEVGFCDTPGYAYGVAVAGGYAYVADGSAGLRVIDVSDPAAPLEVGFLDTPGTAYHVAVAGGYAYVADGASGLRVIDVSNAAAPVEVGSCHPPDLAYGVALASGYAYVADVYGRLRVIDVSDPAAPLEVGSCDTPGYTYGVAVADGYAYVADWFGLTVVDTSNPAAPVEVGYLDTPSLAVGVAVADGYAYVGDYNAGLRVIDITNPAAPVEVGYLDTPGNVYSVAVAGGYAYVADNGWGLVVGGGRGDVAGQVRRRGTTTNLPGATVEARQEGTLKGSDVTGLTGLYSVPNLLPGAYVLTAGKAGYGNQSKSDVRITPGQDGQYVNFNLYPVQLTGQVSQAGTTTYLAGATVRVYQGNVLKASANTDGGGIYRIGGLPDGTYDAVASHAGYVRQFKLDVPIAAGSVTNRNFFLAVSGRLKGQVKDRTTGRNLPGATVFARSGGITWAKTRAKDWAVYEINADLPPGTYVMQASQPGYLSQAKKGIVVTAGATSIVNFNLDPLLKGQVRQAGTTTNLAGATVKVYQADVLRATTTTDARGIYQMGGLAAGTYTAVASKAGYVRQTKLNITISEGAYTYVNFNLSVSGKLQGQVKNRVTGANLIGATVFARSGGIIWATTTTTAPWGIYEINADLPPGTYVMQASRPGYLPQAKKGVIVTAGNTTYVNFSLQPQ